MSDGEGELKRLVTALYADCEPTFRHDGRFGGEGGPPYVVRWTGTWGCSHRGRDGRSATHSPIIIEAPCEALAIRILEAIDAAASIAGGQSLTRDQIVVAQVPQGTSETEIDIPYRYGVIATEAAVRLAVWSLDLEDRAPEYALHMHNLSTDIHFVPMVDLDPDAYREVERWNGQCLSSIKTRVERAFAIVAAYMGIEAQRLDPEMFLTKGDRMSTRSITDDRLKPYVEKAMVRKLKGMRIKSGDRVTWFQRVSFDGCTMVKQLPTKRPVPWCDRNARPMARILADCQEAYDAHKAGDADALTQITDLLSELDRAQSTGIHDITVDYPHAMSYTSWLRNRMCAHAMNDQTKAETLTSFHVANVQCLLSNILWAWSGPYSHPYKGEPRNYIDLAEPRLVRRHRNEHLVLEGEGGIDGESQGKARVQAVRDESVSRHGFLPIRGQRVLDPLGCSAQGWDVEAAAEPQQVRGCD